MAWHISLLAIIALSPHPVLICLIFGVITSYKICKVNYTCFFLNMTLLLIKYKYILFLFTARRTMLLINHYYYLLLLLLLKMYSNHFYKTMT